MTRKPPIKSYLVTWIDRDDLAYLRRTTDCGLAECLIDAERSKEFSTMENAKDWAKHTAVKMDEYGMPRVETRTLGKFGVWIRDEVQEFSEGKWQLVWENSDG